MPVSGSVIRNKYRIEHRLGVGGMGTVFLATDLTLYRQVAIKILDPRTAADEANQRRFEIEAKVARHLTHPNTIQIFDFGRIDNGLPFIVMEYLRGLPLDQLIERQGAMSLQRALSIGKQVLSSLAEAHANGVIHRDLKPSNVIVGEFGGHQDFAKVLDFGIAKLLDSTRDSCSLKTRTGLVMGSPAYMAPERIRGEPLSPQSDLFSFGIMLLEMLYGQSIYAGVNHIEVLSRLIEPAPIPLPRWLQVGPAGRLLSRATQKNPVHRHHSAQEMIQEIDTILTTSDQQTLGEVGAAELGNVIRNVAPPAPVASPPVSNQGLIETMPTSPMSALPDDALPGLARPLGPPPKGAAPPLSAGAHTTAPVEFDDGEKKPSLFSNPLNILLIVLILLLVIGTGVLVSLMV